MSRRVPQKVCTTAGVAAVISRQKWDNDNVCFWDFRAHILCAGEKRNEEKDRCRKESHGQRLSGAHERFAQNVITPPFAELDVEVVEGCTEATHVIVCVSCDRTFFCLFVPPTVSHHTHMPPIAAMIAKIGSSNNL